MSRAVHPDAKALAKTGPAKVAATTAATTLITGATGFLGAHLLRVLAARSDDGGDSATPPRLRVLTQASSAPSFSAPRAISFPVSAERKRSGQ